MPPASQFSPIVIDRVDLKGGLDLVTPTLNLAPGMCRDALNFECSITGGYTRIAGYERYDGQTAPSAAGFASIALSATTLLANGNLIVGQSSGATASVCGTTNLGVTLNGVSFLAGSGSGTFLLGETVKVGATTIGTVTYADVSVSPKIALSALSTLAVGNVLVGQTSGATGTVAALGLTLPVVNTVAFTHSTGTFTNGEVIKVGVTTIGTVVCTNVSIQDALTQATFTAAAADLYRAQISPVPGGGPIRGVAYLNGIVFAWRDNAASGATVCNLYKASGSSWVQVVYGYELKWNAGTAVGTKPTVSQTITGATSGATATIKAVVQQSGGGVWVGSNGNFVVTPLSGTFQAGETLRVGGSAVATCTGAAAQIQPLPGGNYLTFKFNFGVGANANSTKLYGCDSVNRGFEFDGATYVPITTGMTTINGVSADIPTYVVCHKNVLVFAFNASIQTSGLGLPYQWTTLQGAGEIAMPESITNLISLPGNQGTGALGIFTATNTYILYGSTFGVGGNASLVSFNVGTGAIYNTVQNMADTYALEGRGIMGLQTTLNYGNFEPNALTMHIRPLIQQLRNIATDAILNREKSQYRVFFSNGQALYCTFLNQDFIGVMPVQFPDAVLCICEGSFTGAVESTFFGTNSGYVMQLDSGTSFDGVAIAAHITLVFNSEGQHRYLKRYRRASLEIQGSSYTPLSFGYQLGYNSPNISQPSAASYAAPFASSNWDSFVWDNFTWDGNNLSPTEVGMVGTAENVALTIASNTNFSSSFTINTATIHYSQRRILRGGLGS